MFTQTPRNFPIFKICPNHCSNFHKLNEDKDDNENGLIEPLELKQSMEWNANNRLEMWECNNCYIGGALSHTIENLTLGVYFAFWRVEVFSGFTVTL